jgi:hypothetical protein
MRRSGLWRPSTKIIPGARERWVMADFHIHSTYSGGSLTAGEILKMAQIQLLDAVAISDHDNTCGSKEAKILAMRDLKMPQTFISQEISLGNHFHFLLIGGNQEQWGNICRNDFLKRFMAHHQCGGVIILAHPWTMPKSSWARGFLKEIVAESLLDAVELFNSTILELPPENCSWLKSFWEDWIAPNHLGVVGGSDFHYHRQGRGLGSGRTYIKVVNPGEKGILDALRNRRCVAGLFSYRSFDLGWLGKGNHILLGMEPWLGELKQLVGDLQAVLKKNQFLKPGLKKNMGHLIECGYYQMAWELLLLS